jgi:hypothetical protein
VRSLPTLITSVTPVVRPDNRLWYHSTIGYLSSESAGNAVTVWPRKPEIAAAQ